MKLSGRRSRGLARGLSGASVGPAGGLFARFVILEYLASQLLVRALGREGDEESACHESAPKLFPGEGWVPLSPFRLTRRAPDKWESPHFLGLFLARAGFRFESDSHPAHLRVTPGR